MIRVHMEVPVQDSVLTLGEKIVLAARLAAIEHVRQEVAAIAEREQDEKLRDKAIAVGDRAPGFKDEPAADVLTRPVPDLLTAVFRKFEAHDPTIQRKIVPRHAQAGGGMIYGLYLSATGIITNSHQQDVIANNLANAETSGFKRELSLTEARRTEAAAMQAAGGNGGHADPLRDNIGGGQLLTPSWFDQTQGAMATSSNNLDTAVDGSGFIGVQAGGQFRLTRSGGLMIDRDGMLRTTAGQNVVDDQKQPVKLDMAGREASALSIDIDGTIRDASRGGGNQLMGKIGLFEATDPQRVKPVGGNLFAPTEGTELVAAKGKLRQNLTEGSNVDPATELTRLMETQRLLEANANMIKTQDLTLGHAVNELGKIG